MFLENNRVHVKAVKVPQNSYTLHSHTNLTSSHSEDYDVTLSKKFASGLLYFFFRWPTFLGCTTFWGVGGWMGGGGGGGGGVKKKKKKTKIKKFF
jgi:hypothetical protein